MHAGRKLVTMAHLQLAEKPFVSSAFRVGTEQLTSSAHEEAIQ